MADTFLEEVVNYLVAGGIGTRGSTLFDTIMPDEENDDTVTVIQEFPGGPMPFHTRAPIINLAATIRARTYALARGKADAIIEYLHAKTDVILENSRVLYFACNTAGSIGQDDRERELVRMNFLAMAHSYVALPADGTGGSGTGDEAPPGGKDPNPGDLQP